MKQVRAMIWVNPNPESDRGQCTRPCFVDYSVNPIGSKSLYRVERVVDARNGEVYAIEGDTGVLALNMHMDETIAAADPNQRKFALKELGVDLRHPPKKKAVKPKKISRVEEDEDGLPL